MTVLPGSMDNLYYNGILPQIPYEAYDYGYVGPYAGMINPYSGLKQAITGVGYLNAAKGGLLYDTYNSKDSFIRRSMSGIGSPAGGGYSIKANSYGPNAGMGGGYDVALNSYGETGVEFINSIRNTGARAKEAVLNAPSSSIWKGLAAAALIIATPILIFKRKKLSTAEIAEMADAANKSSFWSKLNPKNWFKK